MKDYKYLIYRIYNKKERQNEQERIVFYGWSTDKNVITAFLQQRDPDKYKVFKRSNEYISEMYSEDITDYSTMVDFIKIKSVNIQDDVLLFITAKELQECEKKIQRIFYEQSSLSLIKGNISCSNYVAMITNLDLYYFDALQLIGYRPHEIDDLYPSADYHDDFSSIEKINEQIDSAYDGSTASPEETFNRDCSIPGLTTLTELYCEIIYSLESFVKVLKDDM